jgi:hypothetical protein
MVWTVVSEVLPAKRIHRFAACRIDVDGLAKSFDSVSIDEGQASAGCFSRIFATANNRPRRNCHLASCLDSMVGGMLGMSLLEEG